MVEENAKPAIKRRRIFRKKSTEAIGTPTVTDSLSELFGIRPSEPTEAPTEAPKQAERAEQVRSAPEAAPAPAPVESAPTPAEQVEEPGEPVVAQPAARRRPSTSLLFQAPPELPDLPELPQSAQRRDSAPAGEPSEEGTVRRRARRRPGDEGRVDDPANTVVKVRTQRAEAPRVEEITEPQRIKGSTRLEAKKQRRRDGRDAGRRRAVVTEAEFLARRESVERVMVVRSEGSRIEIGVLEDSVLAEHYVAKSQNASLIGNVYLGKVQNVLPSMEAAFVDIGRGRNAVLYSGEVDWEAAAAESDSKNQPRRIELALKPGDKVLVQVTKDPVGHKGARLTSQVSLPGRYLVYVPNGSMNGISRKLPDTERARLKKILKEVLPENTGVIIRTAAEGATEDQLTLDVNRLTAQWAEISRIVENAQAPALLHSEPDLLIKIIRDVFNEDFSRLVIQGDDARETIEGYLRSVAPDLLERVEPYTGNGDAFSEFRVAEQIEKALDRKVWLPSGGSLVIDRTEAMTVVDVNTGKFVGSGGNLEETVTKNNLEAAEEIVRQLRLRDIGGIIVIDFIDMVLENNRDLVLRRLVECLSRDRTKHQVAEVTSLGLVQMTRKKLGLGLAESMSDAPERPEPKQENRRRKPATNTSQQQRSNGTAPVAAHAITENAKNALAQIAASTIHRDPEPVAASATSSATSTAAAASTERPKFEFPESADAPAAEEPASAVSAGDSGSEPSAAPQRASRGGRGSRSRSTRAASSTTESAGDSLPADAATGAPVEVAATAEPVRAEQDVPEVILDIPVAARSGRKRVPAEDAESILGSVLQSLPEPKLPGQGRSRNRRVSTPALTTPTISVNTTSAEKTP